MGRTRLHPAPVSPGPAPRRSAFVLVAWALALTAAGAPLWIVRDLPFVDLPQHFYVLDVMRRLHDPATLYSQYFEWHVRFTPYLGYYAVMGLLAHAMPIELANRVFLSAVVLAFPLSTAFLLRSLGRAAWPALLVVPLAYGDCMGWGFVNVCAAIPMALFTLAAAIRALSDSPNRTRWCAWFGALLLAGFFMHPVPSLFLALALPLALLLTRAADEASAGPWRARLPVMLSAVPALAMVVVWLVLSRREPTPIRPGVPGYAWGPIFSPENLQWDPAAVKLEAFFGLLANLFRNDADLLGLYAVGAVAAIAVAARFFESAPATTASWRERARPPVFVALAFGLYLALPRDIQGAVQYLHPRFVPLTGLLLAGLVPRVGRVSERVLIMLATLAVLMAMTFVGIRFRVFDEGASALRRLLPAVAERPRIMGLIHELHSDIVTHPAYLHAAATLAREKGGIPSYTLMGWQQAPLRYRGAPPPAPNEWRPDLFDFDTMAPAYDHFLLRGVTPETVFGAHLGPDLRVAAHEGDWWLVRRVR